MELLLQSNWLGLWHPIMVHFPIVLFSLTLMLDMLQTMGFVDSPKPATWLLTLGVLFLIPTLISGWEASYAFPKEDPMVREHLIRALFLTPYALLYAIMRLFGREAPSIVYIGLSVVLVGLTYWTSNYGGILTHGETPFSLSLPRV